VAASKRGGLRKGRLYSEQSAPKETRQCDLSAAMKMSTKGHQTNDSRFGEKAAGGFLRQGQKQTLGEQGQPARKKEVEGKISKKTTNAREKISGERKALP